MKKIKTFVVNLPKEKARRENMQNLLSPYQWLNAEFVEAIYGKDLSAAEIDQSFDLQFFRKNYRRSVLSGEIGCTLSHRLCFRKFLETENEVALILEDDIRFHVADNFQAVLFKSVQFLESEKPAVLLLDGSSFWYRHAGQLFLANYELYKIHDALFTSGYLINRAAARLMLHENRPGYVADDWRYYIRKGVAVYAISPSIVRQSFDLFETSIQNSQRMPIKVRYSITDLPLLIDKIKTRFCIRLRMLSLKTEQIDKSYAHRNFVHLYRKI